jgi:hypothetical protein
MFSKPCKGGTIGSDDQMARFVTGLGDSNKKPSPPKGAKSARKGCFLSLWCLFAALAFVDLL